MLGTNHSPSASANANLTDLEKTKFAIGLSLFKIGAYAQAYRAFSELSSKPDASVQFNLALCNILSEDYQNAVLLLEKALRFVPTIQKDIPSDNIHKKLRNLEKSNESYKAAFSPELPVVFPQYAKECIRRCLIDVYAKLGVWEKVRSTAATLGDTGFLNVDTALSVANSHGGN